MHIDWVGLGSSSGTTLTDSGLVQTEKGIPMPMHVTEQGLASAPFTNLL